MAGEPITAVQTHAPGNGAAIGGLKVSTRNGWFAARPSGTEDVYKIYAESLPQRRASEGDPAGGAGNRGRCAALMRLCVFCGSAAGARPEYLAMARQLAATMATRGIGLVYGGASVGLMGALADAALEAGGEVHGVIPRSLCDRELAHGNLTALHVVSSMHERKALMAELSDGFIALPGGIGTLEELFEVWTWAQLGIHAKPVALLDVAGYYRDLLRFLDGAVDDGLLRPAVRELLISTDDPVALIDRLTAH